MSDATRGQASRREFLRWVSLSGVGIAVGSAVPAALASGAQAADGADITVLAHGTVIDGTGARPRPDTTVVLVGDRIVWAGAHREVPVPAGARVVDVRGKFVIPGLWDMHTHGSDMEDIFPPLHIANGVTGIREMWGYAENRATRDKIERGELLGPRVVMASSIIDGPVTLLGPPVTQVGTEAEARAAVRTAQAEGSDFVKVYSYLPAAPWAAILDEASRLGLPVGGHWSYRTRLVAAAEAGQRSFEHLFGLSFATSSREEEFLRTLDATPFDPADRRRFFNLARELERQSAESYHPAKAARVFAKLARAGSWQSPTLAVLRVVSSPADTFANDPRLKYVPGWVRDFWKDRLGLFAPSTPEQIVQYRAFFQAQMRLVGEAHAGGVGIIGGTDCLNPYVFPGFAVHDELTMLVRAGLSPMSALQTVTRDAARYLGRERTMGTVTAGKVADLVVLDRNPLADIRNTQSIHAVVTRGRLIDAAERQRMLAAVEEAAGQPAAPALVAANLARMTCGCHG